MVVGRDDQVMTRSPKTAEGSGSYSLIRVVARSSWQALGGGNHAMGM
jgi:hypothetical protein